MKITKSQIKQLIKEELEALAERDMDEVYSVGDKILVEIDGGDIDLEKIADVPPDFNDMVQFGIPVDAKFIAEIKMVAGGDE